MPDSSLHSILNICFKYIEKFHSVEQVVHQDEAPAKKNNVSEDNQPCERFTIPKKIHNKFRDVVNFYESIFRNAPNYALAKY
jgi:hypothetical protein